jgi:hypothetical protein
MEAAEVCKAPHTTEQLIPNASVDYEIQDAHRHIRACFRWSICSKNGVSLVNFDPGTDQGSNFGIKSVGVKCCFRI